MKLRWSKYVNIYSNSDKAKGYVIYNSLNRVRVKVDLETMTRLEGYFAGERPDDETKRIISELYIDKVIVKEEFDDIAYAKEIIKKKQQSSKVLAVVFVPTYSCNFKCPYCIVTSTDHKCSSEIVSKEDAKKLAQGVIDYAIKQDMKEIDVSFFGGEPTLALEQNVAFLEELKRLADNKISVTAMIVTNGFLLNDENLNILKKANIRKVQITIDGPEEIHNQTRIHITEAETYQTIIKNLQRLKDNNMFATIRINFSAANIRSINELLLDLKDKDINKIADIMLAPIDANAGSDIDGHTMEALKWVQSVYNCAVECGFNIIEWSTACGTGTNNYIVVDLKGDIYSCNSFAGLDGYQCGNIQKDKIDTEALNSYLPNIQDSCWNCELLGTCESGCKNQEIMKHGGKHYCDKMTIYEMSKAYHIAKYLL